MPPQIKRQNAFNDQEPLSIACRICYQNEACGDWIRVTCQCSITDDYYHAHEFCLQKRNGKCKVCGTHFIKQSSSSPPKSLPYRIATLRRDMKQFEKGYLMMGGIIALVFLLMYRIYLCTVIELVDEIDDIWLPVKSSSNTIGL